MMKNSTQNNAQLWMMALVFFSVGKILSRANAVCDLFLSFEVEQAAIPTQENVMQKSSIVQSIHTYYYSLASTTVQTAVANSCHGS